MSRRRTAILAPKNDGSAVGVVRAMYAELRSWRAVAASIGALSAPYWRLVALGERKPSRAALKALRIKLGRIVMGEL